MEAAAGGRRMGRRRTRERKEEDDFVRPEVLIHSLHNMPACAPCGAERRLTKWLLLPSQVAKMLALLKLSRSWYLDISGKAIFKRIFTLLITACFM